MNGFSNEAAAMFAAVRLRQILILLEILGGIEVRRLAFVEACYNERARGFAETLAFLEEIDWIRREGDTLCPAPEIMRRLARTVSGDPCERLLEVLVSSPGPHRPLLASYLARFQSIDGVLAYRRPVAPERGERPARDFLMEIGAVAYQPAAGRYIVRENFASLYLWARTVQGPTDQNCLTEAEEKRRAFGRRAENAVVAFEKERVGPDWADEVQHVAADYPAACYDIKSLTVETGSASPRFIEVKAVSPDTFAFCWTATEIEAARLLGDVLFLYLLPVRNSSEFDFDRLKIIPNPFVAIYQDQTMWIKEPSVIVCRQSKPMTS